MGISKISDHIQIKIKMPNPSQEPPASSKALDKDLKDVDVLCTFKIQLKSKNSDHGCIKNQWPYPNQDQDVKPQSGTSCNLKSPKLGLKGHGCYLHIQNQYREKQIGTWVYQRPVTISNLRWRCHFPVSNIGHSPKYKMRDLKDMEVLDWGF